MQGVNIYSSSDIIYSFIYVRLRIYQSTPVSVLYDMLKLQIF